jgi:adenosylcobinamide-GDP ribazoletransferase
MFRGLCSVLSFLTILPSKSEADLNTTAKYMYLFPVVGIIIGVMVGAIWTGLFLVGLDNALILAFVVVTSLAIITGAHHLDGLADFADGLMAKGTPEKKLAAMKDVSTGSAGVTIIVLCIVGTIIALSPSLVSSYSSSLIPFQILVGIILAEVTAKFSMVLVAKTGKSAATGSNTPFLQCMKDGKKQFVIACVITVLPLIFIGTWSINIITFGTCIVFTLILVKLATNHFGGVTGDVFGATNELSRLVFLLVFVGISYTSMSGSYFSDILGGQCIIPYLCFLI